ncbi:MAG: AGE family epimerase/isomerase [Cyclobacteriaceae bacterium]|nr:AGE family epimerase/isomerase [Cyclobacteriaceae bacterium]
MRVAVSFAFLILVILSSCRNETPSSRENIAAAMEHSLVTEVMAKWYPQSIDTVDGGFISTYTYDFKPTGAQDKMIVTQARHTWTNAKASLRYPEVQYYKIGAKHGFEFLKNKMWDKTYGGFYTLIDKQGNVQGDSTKTAYGNAFGIYSLAAYYGASKDTSALALAKETFMWLEKGSHDPILKGYFQHLQRNGMPIKRQADTPSTADTGYKDQNSSIHLLEAFTELYHVWPDELLRERLQEMLLLIRDTIVTPKGNLTLFLYADWRPVTFADSSETVITRHHQLDHVSFGHDVETAYLMLEASHGLGIYNDTTTLRIAKKMVDHALNNGWDNSVGGFYDEAYYFKDKPGITITHDTKNWWAQAEGLNALLLMADLFPDDELQYYKKFETLWTYADNYLIDHEHGDWYAGGLDKQPDMKTALKGHIWKSIYHHYRSLDNCIQRLRGE